MSPLENICVPLYLLGVSTRYRGYHYAAYAVSLCVEEPERLTLVTKLVYPDVAKRYHTSWSAVERAIRTVSATAWKYNRPALEAMLCRPLPAPPTVSELLGALCYTVTLAPADTYLY